MHDADYNVARWCERDQQAMMGRRFYVLLCLLLTLLQGSEGFVLVPRTAMTFGSSAAPAYSDTNVATVLWGKSQSNLDDMQGTKPGIVLLTIAMGICIWGFTIPPEIRRSRLCTDDRCLPNRSRCYDCKTFGELAKEVETYYANGGGIKWDFSVDPNNPFLPENIGK